MLLRQQSLKENRRGQLTYLLVTVVTALAFLALVGPVAATAESGTSEFTGNFESGNLAEWDQVQAITGRVSVVSDVVAQGAYAGRFEVKEGDEEPATGSERAEVISGLEFEESDVRYFHILTRVDAWDFEHWGIIWQIHDQSKGSPPLSLQIKMNKSTPMLWLGPGDVSNEYWEAPLPGLGEWFEIVIRVEFGSKGSLGVWLNREQQSMLNGENTFDEIDTLGEVSGYDKLGIYRSMSSEGTAVVRHDDYRVSKFFPEEAPPIFDFPFGSKGSGNGQFSSPTGIATDAQGNAWVADTSNNRVQQFNPKGEYLTKFGSLGSGNGQFYAPSGIAIDSKGNIWVVDSGNNRVQQFNSKGEYITKFGSLGSGNGQLNFPTGIAIDSEGNLWVADWGNNRVQKFNSSGGYIAKFGTKGSSNGQLESPSGIAIDSGGHLWVADFGNNRVQEFNSSGEYVSKFGTKGSGNGQLESPASLVINSQGNLWVTDSANNRVQKFNPKGEYLTKFGAKGTGIGQFESPRGIALDPAGDLMVTDTNNNRVQKFVFN